MAVHTSVAVQLSFSLPQNGRLRLPVTSTSVQENDRRTGVGHRTTNPAISAIPPPHPPPHLHHHRHQSSACISTVHAHTTDLPYPPRLAAHTCAPTMLLNTATLAFTSLFLLPASAQAPGAAAGQAQANAAAAAAAAQGAGQNPAALAAASAVSVASVASVQQAADAAAAAQAAATTAAAAPVDTAAAVADPAVPVSTAAAAAAAAAQATGSVAGTWPGDIVGTWSTKSKQTLTGPGFYDPIDERLIEPSKPGISYSFTADGWYEEAYYRAIANPTNPKCPSGIMQWQHGNWVMNGTGSLILTPIAVDGRQLLSSPCDYDDGIYTRYNTSEVFEVRFSPPIPNYASAHIHEKKHKSKRQDTNTKTALFRLHRPLPQRRAPRPLPIRRQPHAPHVHRLHVPGNAPDLHPQPHDRHRRLHRRRHI